MYIYIGCQHLNQKVDLGSRAYHIYIIYTCPNSHLYTCTWPANLCPSPSLRLAVVLYSHWNLYTGEQQQHVGRCAVLVEPVVTRDPHTHIYNSFLVFRFLGTNCIYIAAKYIYIYIMQSSEAPDIYIYIYIYLALGVYILVTWSLALGP